jgi:hypothetical protein
MDAHPMNSLQPAVSPRSRMWLGLSLLFVFLRMVPTITYPLARDQATFCFIAQRMLDGKRLYLDLWDNKPPGIFYIYALIVKLFGTAMWSVGVVDVLWLLVFSYLLFRFTERFLGTVAAVIAVVLHATWRAWMGYWDAAQSENFLVLFVLAAYFLSASASRRRWLHDACSGLLFGMAFWLKYTAVAFLPLVLILPYLDFSPLDAGAQLPRFTVSGREWMKHVCVWAAAFAASVVAVLTYIRSTGAWAAMIEAQFVVLPRYNSMLLERSKSYRLFAYHRMVEGLGLWSILVLLIAILVARRTKNLARTWPVFLATGMGTVSLAMQTRLPSYAFESCYPFYAMLWGYVGAEAFMGVRFVARSCSRRGFRLAAVMVWIVFANVIYLPLPDEAVQFKLYLSDLRAWRQDSETFYANYPWARPISHYASQMHVIQYLRRNSTSQDGVFVWGSEPLIYFMAQRNPPTRFITNIGLVSLWTPPAWRPEFMRDLEDAPPRYIVVARDDSVAMITFVLLDSEAYLQTRFPAFRAFVDGNYRQVDKCEYFTIYRHD